MLILRKYLSKYFSLLIIVFSLVFLVSYSTLKTSAQNLSSEIKTEISLITETLNSYTPPFYEGKPLPAESGEVKILAKVSIQTPAGTFDSSRFFYSWFVNGQRSHTYSGTGNNYIFLQLDPLVNANTIELKVYSSSRLEQLLGDKSITLYPRKAKIILYRDLGNPILNYANAINKRFQDYILPNRSTLSVLAEPYYFSVDTSTNPLLNYTWSVNGIPGNLNNSGPRFQYDIPRSRNSTFTLGLKIDNPDKTLQSDEAKVNFSLPKE